MSRASDCAPAISSAGAGLSNLSSTLADFTVTRLPESSSTCIELSASAITRPARNFPPSSNNTYVRRIVAEPDGRAPYLEMDSAHHLLHGDGFRGQRWLRALVALGGRAVGEHAEARVHHDLRDARQQRVQHLARHAEPRGDAHGLGD